MIEKIAQYKEEIYKKAETSYLRDFVSGIDPTGVSTFRAAQQNEKNHGKHKFFANLGGFTSGVAMGGLVPAGLMGAAALAMKKKNPGLSHDFGNMAKGSLDSFHPGKLKRYVQSFGDLSKYKTNTMDLISDFKKMNVGADHLEGKLKSSIKGKDLSELAKKVTKEDVTHAKNIGDGLKGLRKKTKELNDLEAHMSKKYYNGDSVPEGAEKSMTALSTLGTSALGGALNAGSSEMQYNTALDMKKKGKDQIQKKASVADKLKSFISHPTTKSSLIGAGAGGALGAGAEALIPDSYYKKHGIPVQSKSKRVLGSGLAGAFTGGALGGGISAVKQSNRKMDAYLASSRKNVEDLKRHTDDIFSQTGELRNRTQNISKGIESLKKQDAEIADLINEAEQALKGSQHTKVPKYHKAKVLSGFEEKLQNKKPNSISEIADAALGKQDNIINNPKSINEAIDLAKFNHLRKNRNK